MVSGMLLDEASDGSAFHAYMLKHSLQNKLPVKTIDTYKIGDGHTIKLILFAQDPYRSRNDDIEDATPEFNADVKDAVYTFNIDNTSIDVKLPLM